MPVVCKRNRIQVDGCMEKLVTKDGFSIYLKNVLKIASISVGGHIIISNSERFDLYHFSSAHFSVKDIYGVCNA